MTTVSPATEKKLRDAMQRLLAGEPKRTDGRLTKTNLHIEAGVSRATMNRADAVIADWNTAVGTQTAPRDAQIIELREAVSKLKQTIVRLRQRNTELEEKEPGRGNPHRRTPRPATCGSWRRAARHSHALTGSSGT